MRETDMQDEAEGRELSPRERRFSEEYALRENGAEAARRAGFSYRSARQLASRMLARDDITAAVEAERARLASSLRVDRDSLVAELAKVAFANLLDYSVIDDDGGLRTDFSNVNRVQATAIQSVETEQVTDPETGAVRVTKVKFKLHDKARAVAELARLLGLAEDKVRVVSEAPGMGEVQSVLLQVLGKYPEARAAVVAALEGLAAEPAGHA
jgi:phage terminase small subunit